MPQNKHESDGCIFRFCWAAEGGCYRVWLERDPSMFECADTWEAAEQAIYDRVNEEIFGGEWAADWTPIPPRSDELLALVPDYVRLIGDGRHVCFTDPRTLYRQGMCPACGIPSGARTDVPLTTHIESRDHLVQWATGFGPSLYSPQLLDALSSVLPAGVEVREVRLLGRSRTRFLEIVPKKIVPDVLPADSTRVKGWTCAACGMSAGYYSHCGTIVMTDAIERPHAFFRGYDVGLCVPTEWWLSNRKTPCCRSIVASEIWTPKPGVSVGVSRLPVLCHKELSGLPRAGCRRYAQTHKLNLPQELASWIFEARS